MRGWKKVPDAAEYYGVSVRTMRNLISDGFPHSRLPSGTILIELSAGDDWLRNFGNDERDQEIIDDLLTGIISNNS